MGKNWPEMSQQVELTITRLHKKSLDRDYSIDLLCKSMDWFLYTRDQVIQFFGLHSSILTKFLGKFQFTLQILFLQKTDVAFSIKIWYMLQMASMKSLKSQQLSDGRDRMVKKKQKIYSLRKKCPFSELFRSAFFPHFPAFGMNMERYGDHENHLIVAYMLLYVLFSCLTQVVQ